MSRINGKPGRPAIPGPRTEVRFRLYGRDLELAEAAARDAGSQSLADWCRTAVIERARKDGEKALESSHIEEPTKGD